MNKRMRARDLTLIERLMTPTALNDSYWDENDNFLPSIHPSIQEIRDLARTLMERHGLHAKDGWTFDFITNRKKGNIAFCWYAKKQIRFNTRYVFAMEMHQIKDTILHEIAHAITDMRYGRKVQAHGREWRDVCMEIGCRARATVNIRRTFGFNDKWILDIGVDPFKLIYEAEINAKYNADPNNTELKIAASKITKKRTKIAENATKKARECYNKALQYCTENNCMNVLYGNYAVNMDNLGYKQGYIDYQWRLIQRGDLSLAERKKML